MIVKFGQFYLMKHPILYTWTNLCRRCATIKKMPSPILIICTPVCAGKKNSCNPWRLLSKKSVYEKAPTQLVPLISLPSRSLPINAKWPIFTYCLVDYSICMHSYIYLYIKGGERILYGTRIWFGERGQEGHCICKGFRSDEMGLVFRQWEINHVSARVSRSRHTVSRETRTLQTKMFEKR